MSSLRPVLPHFRRRVAGLLTAAVALCGLAVAVAPSAGASAARPHDPIGAVSSVKAATGGLAMTGWAVDPDALTTNAHLVATVDGRGINFDAPTSVANATVRAKYHTGPTPGFAVTVPVVTTASHTLCLSVRNTGAGYHTVLKCVVTPLGSKLTSAQLAAHKPTGAITAYSVKGTSMRVRGWATDSDWITHKLVVVLYVNGTSTATVMTKTYAAPRPTGAGGLSAFDISVVVSPGAHLGCIWVVNVGLGNGNSFLGCKTGDTRGGAGTGAVTTPAINTKVVAEAKKHIGQRYVWGAEGPKTFDCSGLVQYSYGRFGYTTPRVSEDQFLKARLIPASRAVPGDLVFYHDTVGDVYHVGIYLSPGKTVAAIDEAEGVNYQTIWDPSTATYGSFTHT
jgi:cell wall-associated NlpC family hydrolase